jgi:D-xylose reductase
MKTVKETIIPFYKKLNNGVLIPRVGFGTYKIKNLDKLVYSAIKSGIYHFDTASFYENEVEVGLGINQAIKENICKREDIFVVTKLWHNEKNDVEGALKASLQRLNLEYLDLWLIHWPIPNFKKIEGKTELGPSNYEVWRNMEKMVEKGLVKSIGVCNFGVQLLLDLLCYAKIKPVMNQIEFHQYLKLSQI